MRRALRGASIRGHSRLPQPVFNVQYIPPPVGGWNRKDAVPLMNEQDAIVLDNWIPDTNHVRLRGGYDRHALIGVGTAAPVETLIPYHPEDTSTAKMFAAVSSRIIDVTAEATASSVDAVVTGLTNARWQGDQITNAAGSFLVICNGADAPREYDGTTWTTPALTANEIRTSASGTTSSFAIGLNINDLVAVRNHMNRLWFAEEDSLTPYYLPVNNIAGNLTRFLVPFRKGGKLMTIGSWTVDGGSGQDDLIVFISSRGECVLYAGTDPSSVSTWGLQGRYDIPDVIGRRCIVNAGSDLGIITVQGLVPLSQVIRGAVGSASRVAFTDKVSGYFRDQFPVSGNLFGWQSIEFPRGNLVIINVPLVEGEEAHQVVCNVNTGSWCRWRGIPANCWALLNDQLYFGGLAGVYRYDMNRHTDMDEGIIGAMQSAYTTFGTPRTKRFTDARPLFMAAPGYAPEVTLQTDYDTTTPAVVLAVAPVATTQWAAPGDPESVAPWGPADPGDPPPDEFQWAGGITPVVQWDGAQGVGRAVSVAFALSATEETIYNGTDVGFEVGNFL